MSKKLTPMEIGNLVASHVGAKENGWKWFFCRACKHYFKFEDMRDGVCFCCGQGICKKCEVKL